MAKPQHPMVLVVCTGNTCRSPMAEGWLRHKLSGTNWVVQSAGVAARDGGGASPEAIEVMREIGVELSAHRSQALTAGLVDAATFILAMTEGHRREIVHRFPQADSKIQLVKKYSQDPTGDVNDPYGISVEVYRGVRDELVEALGAFLREEKSAISNIQ